ncbi:hypothetical protein I79_012540 [Cricetulus griseus]|uniref:Uncharacterized protein n=1 Tax=Cricetulus griseus TaxID=10029 RepID=G3HP36_CRIGR|nr:hypothetical protein I79_012540 [Cricetulus griseus]
MLPGLELTFPRLSPKVWSTPDVAHRAAPDSPPRCDLTGRQHPSFSITLQDGLITLFSYSYSWICGNKSTQQVLNRCPPSCKQ